MLYAEQSSGHDIENVIKLCPETAFNSLAHGIWRISAVSTACRTKRGLVFALVLFAIGIAFSSLPSYAGEQE